MERQRGRETERQRGRQTADNGIDITLNEMGSE